VEFEYDQRTSSTSASTASASSSAPSSLRALGLTTDEEILRQFYTPIHAHVGNDNVTLSFDRRVLDQEEAKERHSIRGGAPSAPSSPASSSIQKMSDALAKEQRGVGQGRLLRARQAVFLSDVVDTATGRCCFEASEKRAGRLGGTRCASTASPTST